MLTVRFDMRAPADLGADPKALYAAALDMSVWAEEHGCLSITVSEHHGIDDGYLPAPLTLAAAIAGRTKTVPITVAALLLPLHDPIRLAEEMAVLDLVSGGRVSYALGAGYRAEEFAMAGVALADRGRLMEEGIAVLRQAWTGEPFEWQGQTVRVTPKPATPGGPPLLYGGGSPTAARRAARLGLPLFSQSHDPRLVDAYAAEAARVGVDAPGVMMPPDGLAVAQFVARDPDALWARIGPHLLHDALSYQEFAAGGPANAAISSASTIEELKAEGRTHVILNPEDTLERLSRHGILVAHPLCGGTPPEVGWESLELMAEILG